MGVFHLAGLPKKNFLNLLSFENGFDPEGFVMDEAMLFASSKSWWGKKGPRVRPHEGLDICRFNEGGRRFTLPPGCRIPVAFDGVVKAFMPDDFMGQSICVEHEVEGLSFFSVYAHVVPFSDLCVGDAVQEGEVVAGLSAPESFGRGICAHLHLSLMRAAPEEPGAAPENWRWEALWNTDGLSLYDPAPLLGHDFSISGDASDALLWARKEGEE